MPIKTTITGDVPFLKTYVPYSIDDSLTVCDYVDQMVSVDLAPLADPTIITYFIGAESSYSTTFSVKNITSNSKLNVIVDFDFNVFLIDGGMQDINVDIEPGETRQFNLEIHKEFLNANVETIDFSNRILLTIKNYQSDQPITKIKTVELLPLRFLPQEITVI